MIATVPSSFVGGASGILKELLLVVVVVVVAAAAADGMTVVLDPRRLPLRKIRSVGSCNNGDES